MSWQRETDEDYRQTITVFLVRENRPKYWEFRCVYCGHSVCELDGKLVHVRDVSLEKPGANGVRVRCVGTKEKFCRMWYEFVLS